MGYNMEFRKLKSLLFLYEISADGKLRNVKSKRVSNGTKDDCGYITFNFPSVKSIRNHYGGVKKFRCHQLVMEAWGKEKPFENARIDHIDRNTYNNHISNLRWVTPKENYHNSDYFETVGCATYYDGIQFPSRNAAAEYMSQKLNITVKCAEGRLRRGDGELIQRSTKYPVAVDDLIFDNLREASNYIGNLHTKNMRTVEYYFSKRRKCIYGHQINYNPFVTTISDKESKATIDT